MCIGVATGEGEGLIMEELLVKDKEEVKYISDGQGMKLGQCVSAQNYSEVQNSRVL